MPVVHKNALKAARQSEKRRLRNRAVQAGVNNYIVKPFTAAALKERIDLILDKLKTA